MKAYYALIELYTEQNVPRDEVIRVFGLELAAESVLQAVTIAGAYCAGGNRVSRSWTGADTKPELMRVAGVSQRKTRGVTYEVIK